MRSNWRKPAACALALALALGVTNAQATEVQSDIEAMKDMVRQLQDQMADQQVQIEEQNRVLDDAGLNAEASESGISSFLESTDFSGFVAASYTWNVRNEENDKIRRQNNTDAGLHYPFHPDSNTFALDQTWFTMDKAPSEESRGGFHVDMLFGNDARDVGGNGSFGNDSFELFTAYVSYLAPIGEGVQIDAGELATLLGAEVVQANANFNITRGLVWGLQPVTHTGVIASTEVSGISIAAGFVNAPLSDSSRDKSNNKAFTGGLGFGDDTYSASTSIIYGSRDKLPRDEDDKIGIWDVLLTADPSENLSLWFNADWVFPTVEGAEDLDAFGLALAGRLAVTDTTGVALRGEYVIQEEMPDFWELTLTLDHALTDNLIAKLEGRYDDSDRGNVFDSSKNRGSKDDQWVILAQMLYEF